MNKKFIVTVSAVALLTLATVFASGEKESVNSTLTIEDAKRNPGGELVITPQEIGYKNAEIELTWQPCPPHSMSSTQIPRQEDIKAKAEAFVKKYPNVKIIPVGTTTSVNDSMTKLQVTVVQGDAPDLCAIDSFIMPQFAEYAQPITKYVEAAGISKDDFFPYIQKETINSDGDIIALWYTTDVRGLFYRKDLIQTPPKTMDELYTVAQDMSDKGLTGLIYCGGRDEATTNNTWGLLWSQGAKIANEDGTIAFEDGKGKDAMLKYLTFFADTINKGITPITVLDYKNEPAMYGDVQSDKVAMFIGGNFAMKGLRENMGEENFNNKWGFAAIPTLEKGLTPTSSAGGWTNVVFTKDPLKQQLAAELAIMMYSSDEAMESWCEVGGYLPTRKSAYEKFEYLKADPLSPICLELLNEASTRPPVESYSQISAETQVAIGNILTGSATPQKALESLISDLKEY
jgi:multiple sugar transport system substrate-binding protein